MNDKNIDFDMNAILNDSVRNGQRESAKGLFLVFRDFIDAGFTEEQAMEILKTLMINIKGQVG